MPMSAWLGLTHDPGEAASHGPVDARTGRELAARLDPATRWCLTLTDPAGHAVAHACARGRPPGNPARDLRPAYDGPPGSRPQDHEPPGTVRATLTWAAGLAARMQTLETGTCSHVRQSARYRPPPSLRHLIVLRQRTCTAPGCRRAAAHCDLDHTIPYDQGGRTCECNLGAALPPPPSRQAGTRLAPRATRARSHDLAAAQRPDLRAQPATPTEQARAT